MLLLLVTLEFMSVKDDRYLFSKKTISFVRDLCSGKETELTDVRPRVLAYTMFGAKALSRYGQYVRDVSTEAAHSKLYNSWQVWVYHEGVVTDKFAEEVAKINPLTRFCDVRDVGPLLKADLVNMNGMSWRFIPVGDESVDVACSRDLDSPIYLREETAVSDWLKSDKMLHVMRDSIYHTSEIMGGLWCLRNMKNRTLGRHVLDLVLRKAQSRNSTRMSEATKGNDQNVLNRHVWPLLVGDCMHHDAYLCSKYKGSIPFPTQRRNTTYYFIGCRRPCHGAMEDKPKKCPVECRPAQHKNWEFC